jgi:hypothetical protein
MTSQITVFRSADESASEDAAKVQQMLVDSGIAATLLDDTVPGVPSGSYEVRVDPENVARAEQLVAQFPPDTEMVDVDPSSALDLVTVFQAAGVAVEVEVAAIQSLLESNGIACVIVGDSRLHIGEEVRVAREQGERAIELIREAQAAGPGAADEAESTTENI